MSKKTVPTPKITASDQAENSMDFSKLEVRLSQTKSLHGAAPGRGVYARGKTHGRSVFLKGDTIIPKISGALAMRTQVREGKYIDWLVHQKTFTRLQQDSHVMWSCCEIPLSQRSITGNTTQTVEIGCKPDDCSVFINHSDQPNVTVEAHFEDILERASGEKYLRDNPVNESTVYFQVKTTKDIADGDELFWQYAPSPDFTGTSYRLDTSEATFSEEHSQLVKHCTAALTGEPLSELKEIDHERDFHQQRWSTKYRHHKQPQPLSADEEKFKARFNKGGSDLLLHRALQKCTSKARRKKRIHTYVSIRMKEGGSFKELLKNLFTCMTQNKLACSEISGKGQFSRSKLYQYCCDNGFTSPEQEPDAIPLKWVRAKIRHSTPESPEHKYWQSLLCLRIKAAVFAPEFNKRMLRTNLTELRMPNPLRNDKNIWHTDDFSVLAGAIGQYDCEQGDRAQLIKQYLQEKGRESAKTATSKAITDDARRGATDAVKAIIIRYLSNASQIAGVLRHFNSNNIQLFIDGRYTAATEQTLSTFIRTNLTSEERRGLQGYRWRDTSDLLDLIRKNQTNNDIHKEIYSRIRTGENGLLDRFIRARIMTTTKVHGKTIPIPSSDIARKLNDVGFRKQDDSRYTAADINKYRTEQPNADQ